MNKQHSTSGFPFGLIIFVGLLPLACTFSPNGTQLLLETSFKYVIWSGQSIVFTLLLLTKFKLHKNQLIGLTALCALVPFTFYFSNNGLTFLILNQYTSSILSWAIASVLLSRLYMNANMKSGH